MKDSNIEWTDHTFNPWIGCTKVSPGCTNCYAEALNKRWRKGVNWGKGAPRQRTKTWGEPVKWNRDQEKGRKWHFPPCPFPIGGNCSCRRPRVFCASLADWLDDEVPIEWLADLLKLIHETPNLDWQLLTKRPENWRTRVALVHAFSTWSPLSDMCLKWLHTIHPTPPSNVWIGTTVEDQKRADERIPELLKIPARVRFLSCEPLLEEVNLNQCAGYVLMGDQSNPGYINAFNGCCYHPLTCKTNWNDRPENGDGIHWVIVGGESGPKARLFNVDWARSIVQQCQSAGVPVFVKQLGANIMGREMDKWVTRIKDKKGGTMSEWPQELQIREFPSAQPVHV